MMFVTDLFLKPTQRTLINNSYKFDKDYFPDLSVSSAQPPAFFDRAGAVIFCSFISKESNKSTLELGEKVWFALLPCFTFKSIDKTHNQNPCLLKLLQL